ncbi:hypothetical protein SAY87_023070 [Trapa incisa]|uniref:Gamma-tubulin complex component n=1 Tax=Trapa incisa TaxID=236973 RepID=A0AAN7K550_9MYRT|nr:hypothetical protein SAY87_023070 [Trapa incisa]
MVVNASVKFLIAYFASSLTDELKMDDSEGLVHKIHCLLADGLHFAAPFTNTRTNEADVVRLGIRQRCCICFSSKTYADCIYFSKAFWHSSLCSSSELLLDIIHGPIPPSCLEMYECGTASEVAAHILDYLYEKLDEACLVQGGEEEPYQLVLHLFVVSLQPYVQGLDSWNTDPFDDMFFHANNTISLKDPEFGEKSTQYLNMASATDPVPLKGDNKEIRKSVSGRKETSNDGHLLCPMFLKDIAISIVFVGKSLQLIRYVPTMQSIVSCGQRGSKVNDIDASDRSSLTLSETFYISVASFIGLGDHI